MLNRISVYFITIYKNGSNVELHNYPKVTCKISKVYERIIIDFVEAEYKHQNRENQCGFRAGIYYIIFTKPIIEKNQKEQSNPFIVWLWGSKCLIKINQFQNYGKYSKIPKHYTLQKSLIIGKKRKMMGIYINDTCL